MRSLLIAAALVATLCLAIRSAEASSYQTVLMAIVDPIQSISSGVHPYSGPNLEPFVSAASADLSYAVLTDADLYVADLRFVNLTGSDLDGANLAYALLIDGVLVDIRLVGANLSHAYLSGADLTNAIVGGAADLSNADLSGATLAGANLLQAVLSNADLTDADLSGTSLKFTSLEGATLDGALYDENTIFPFDTYYDSPPWGIDGAGTSPWGAGMIPAPEPSIGSLLVFGVGGLAGLARRRPVRRAPLDGSGPSPRTGSAR
jgi:hypothetical protein